jgi:hypothetical protein
MEWLVPDDFHQHPLPSSPVELPEEDLLPGAKVQPAFGDRDHDFPPRDLPLDMSIGVVFSLVVMTILAHEEPSSLARRHSRGAVRIRHG